MTRSVYGAGNRRRHKKVLARAKGFFNRRKNCFRIATLRVDKALQYQYRDRRNKKRDFRALWIQRINAGARQLGLSYSRFMNGCKKANIQVDRKVLAHLAMHDSVAFKAIFDQAKAALK
ncbi:MAG: 50S ribosomal protein L20 [Pseudomonadaceae bacterium]|nr:50S ribosomal protein L20 [Pseudomonadaceae bacterium]